MNNNKKKKMESMDLLQTEDFLQTNKNEKPTEAQMSYFPSNVKPGCSYWEEQLS